MADAFLHGMAPFWLWILSYRLQRRRQGASANAPPRWCVASLGSEALSLVLRRSAVTSEGRYSGVPPGLGRVEDPKSADRRRRLSSRKVRFLSTPRILLTHHTSGSGAMPASGTEGRRGSSLTAYPDFSQNIWYTSAMESGAGHHPQRIIQGPAHRPDKQRCDAALREQTVSCQSQLVLRCVIPCLYRRPSTPLAALRFLDIDHDACVAASCQRRGFLVDKGKDLRTAALAARGESPSGRRRVFSASSASRNPRNIPDIPPVSLLDLTKNPSSSARKDFHHGLLAGGNRET
ncbi:MAG: hypothetical protein GY854_12690 [Deltaproteobacteria bacterium]|nr:hypothetical protein [Deltaproteobacteria bacterium]